MFVPNAPIAQQTPADPFVDASPVPPLDQVFIFDSRNRNYLDQSSRKVHLRPAEIPLFAQLVLVCFAIVFFAITEEGRINFMRWLFTSSAGTTTQGSVVKKWITSERNLIYHVTFTYIVDGQRYEVYQKVNGAVYDIVNKTVDIIYWPNDPSVARLVGAFEVKEMARNSFLKLALPGLMGSGLLVFAVISFRKWLKLTSDQRLLRSEGRLIYGEVKNINMEKHGKYGYKVTVKYGLSTPDDRFLLHEQVRYPTRMPRSQMPTIGTPVAVLYFNDQLLEIL